MSSFHDPGHVESEYLLNRRSRPCGPAEAGVFLGRMIQAVSLAQLEHARMRSLLPMRRWLFCLLRAQWCEKAVSSHARITSPRWVRTQQGLQLLQLAPAGEGERKEEAAENPMDLPHALPSRKAAKGALGTSRRKKAPQCGAFRGFWKSGGTS
jgi:hypothetical protein